VTHMVFALDDAGNVASRLFGAQYLKVLWSHPTVVVEVDGRVCEDECERVWDLVGGLEDVEHDGRHDVATAVVRNIIQGGSVGQIQDFRVRPCDSRRISAQDHVEPTAFDPNDGAFGFNQRTVDVKAFLDSPRVGV